MRSVVVPSAALSVFVEEMTPPVRTVRFGRRDTYADYLQNPDVPRHPHGMRFDRPPRRLCWADNGRFEGCGTFAHPASPIGLCAAHDAEIRTRLPVEVGLA